MILTLLFSLIAGSTWSWDASDTATDYRLYWSPQPVIWFRAQSVLIPAQYSSATMQQYPRQEYDDVPIESLTSPLPGFILFFVITAQNSAGESGTGHGPILPIPEGVCIP